MAIMNVLTTDDMSYVKVEIRNVSVNYYRYDENIPKQLYEGFKSDSPTKVTFGSENAYTHEFKKLLYNSGYEIKEDGTVVTRKREVCYNSIEHSIDTVKQ